MELFFQPNISSQQNHLSEDESRHCIKVLRHKSGDIIHLTDGKGHFYEAKIDEPHHKKCTFTILSTNTQAPLPYHIHLAMAPTKNIDRTLWVVEKAVEIGIDEISFFTSFHSERRQLKTDRIIARAVSAMKQSVKAYMPLINELTDIKNILKPSSQSDTQKFIAYIEEPIPPHLFQQASPKQSYLILIGPEGDFSKEEVSLAIENGFVKTGLGSSRLRTETAAIAACHTLHLLNL